MPSSYCPRLSEAKTLLPLLRAELIAAAPRYSLPNNISLDLLPIVEDGLFGYEIVPDRSTHTYLTVGWYEAGEAVLRRTVCYVAAPSTLRLAALNGESIACSNFRSRNCPPQRDARFVETSEAVDSGLSQLVALFAEGPRKTVEFNVNVHRYLDEALATAHAYLSQWNPFIEFVGLPDEAQFGFALKGLHGGHGELVSRRPDMWVLRWKSPDAVINEEWAVMLPESNATSVSPAPNSLSSAIGVKLWANNGKACDIAARPGQASDDTGADEVASGVNDDRYRGSSVLRRNGCVHTVGSDEFHLEPNELLR
jgi:hypothetical protein